MWGETQVWVLRVDGRSISTHSPRVGRDLFSILASIAFAKFQPTLPVWGETWISPWVVTSRRYFNPLSPCGERRGPHLGHPVFLYFNPLSPCGERPVCSATVTINKHISTHSPRVGRDTATAWTAWTGGNFNPLSPCGERPQSISRSASLFYFNPLSPCGERLRYPLRLAFGCKFQPTLPVWGETKTTGELRELSSISTHSPRVGRDN